jgi:hypothetical protein
MSFIISVLEQKSDNMILVFIENKMSLGYRFEETHLTLMNADAIVVGS